MGMLLYVMNPLTTRVIRTYNHKRNGLQTLDHRGKGYCR